MNLLKATPPPDAKVLSSVVAVGFTLVLDQVGFDALKLL